MSVSHLEVLVEEPSMEAALRVLLPRVLGELSFGVYPYQCKHDLLKRLPQRLQGYSSWLPDDYRVVVVVDRDDDDCRTLKQRLEQMADDAGLRSRSSAAGPSYQVVNRLAIEEQDRGSPNNRRALATRREPFAQFPSVSRCIARVDHDMSLLDKAQAKPVPPAWLLELG